MFSASIFFVEINCHSERQRRIFIVKMLHSVQHDSERMISEVQTDISLPSSSVIRMTMNIQNGILYLYHIT